MEVILHISDVHFGWEGSNPSGKADREVCLSGLLERISKLEKEWKPTIVCLSGDVGWRGVSSDYVEAKQWLDRLLSCCELDYTKLIVSPGNHDSCRSEARKNARPSAGLEADEVLQPPIADQFIRPFYEFIGFCKNANIPYCTFEDLASYLVGQRIIGGVRFVV